MPATYPVRVLLPGVVTALCLGASCSGPTSPKPEPPPPTTAPVIRSIAVPAGRVEAGHEIEIKAAVEDAETPLSDLAYHWTTSAGTITGSGTTAIWQMAPGITHGVNVSVSLTVTETFEALEGARLVRKSHVVTATSSLFRVHDSEAETKELARKFLVDLFGNSSVSPDACMVDFTRACADLDGGFDMELGEIRNHRKDVVVLNSTVLAQRVAWRSADSGSVHSAMLYVDQVIGFPGKPPTCGDFEVTVIYLEGRWWLCQSFFNEDDRSHCPANVSNQEVARILRSPGRGGPR